VGKVGTQGVEMQAVGGRNLNNITGINLGLSLTMTGVTISFKLRRGRVAIYVPVLLTPKADPWALLVAAIVQSTVNAAVVALVKPYQVGRKEGRRLVD